LEEEALAALWCAAPWRRLYKAGASSRTPKLLQCAGWRRAQLCGQQAEPITLEKLGAAISATGEELQLSERKMAFAAGHNQR